MESSSMEKRQRFTQRFEISILNPKIVFGK